MSVHATANPAAGEIVATVEIAAPPERVFEALTSRDIVGWWVRPGVFDTSEWEGDVRVGGRWRSAGIARGKPYALEGEYLAVEPPRRLIHTWHLVGTPQAPSTVEFLLEAIPGGTRITLRHSGITSSDSCMANLAGWETSFARLIERFNERQLLVR